MLLVAFSFFLFTSLLFYGLFALSAGKKAHIQKRVDRYVFDRSPAVLSEASREEDKSFVQRVVVPAWKNMKRNYQKRLNQEKASKLEIKLLQAGQPFGLNPVEFKIAQLSLVIILPLLAAGAVFALHASAAVGMLLAFFALGAGMMIPNVFLNMKAKQRTKEALKDLPDMLDLLTISLEAGLGFDAALSKVVSKKSGVLSDEFKMCLEEIRLGKTRKEALTNINFRLSLKELQGLTSSIIQAEKLGIGMVSVLKVQTEDIREQRKQRAEEQAMKAPIKMLFPLVLFIFPTLFIILLGPAVLQFLDAM